MTIAADTSPSYRTHRIVFAALALAILMVPLAAMQFTSEVNWNLGDFAVMGAILAALYTGIELTLRLARTNMGRVLAVVACILAFLTIWVELAVGIFD